MPMFRIKRSITGGHEPGEVKSDKALRKTGCDIEFLLHCEAIEPVDGPELVEADDKKPDDETIDLDDSTDPNQPAEPDGLEEMTVVELRELAEHEQIDLGDASRKADIVAAIRLAREKD